MLYPLSSASSMNDWLKTQSSTHAPSTAAAGFSALTATSNQADGADARATMTVSRPGNAQSVNGISSGTINALLAIQGQRSDSAPVSPAFALRHLFSGLDTDGNGNVSKSEFASALGAGGMNLPQADDVFSKLDTDGDGSISLKELTKAFTDQSHFFDGETASIDQADTASEIQPPDGASTVAIGFSWTDGTSFVSGTAPLMTLPSLVSTKLDMSNPTRLFGDGQTKPTV